MSVEVVQKNPGWLAALLKRYQSDALLAVGWPVGTDAAGLRYPDGTSVVMVAAVNNYGGGDVPARPFMTLAQEPALRETRPIAVALVPAINRGKATVEQVLADMGPTAEAAFKQTITDLRDPPNAPSTIARKQSDNPLIDTTLMRNSLTHQVRRGRP